MFNLEVVEKNRDDDTKWIHTTRKINNINLKSLDEHRHRTIGSNFTR